MLETLDISRARVAGAVRGLTEMQIDRIAAHHNETGDSVWHSLHVVLATTKCHCRRCDAA